MNGAHDKHKKRTRHKKFRIKPYKCSMGEEEDDSFDYFYWNSNVMKVEINSFFPAYVELVMLYTRHYA